MPYYHHNQHHYHHHNQHYNHHRHYYHNQTYSYQFPLDIVMDEIDAPPLFPAVETLLCHSEWLDETGGNLFQHFQAFLECLVLLDHGVQFRFDFLLPMFHVTDPFTWNDLSFFSKCNGFKIISERNDKTGRITKINNFMFNK